MEEFGVSTPHDIFSLTRSLKNLLLLQLSSQVHASGAEMPRLTALQLFNPLYRT